MNFVKATLFALLLVALLLPVSAPSSRIRRHDTSVPGA